MLDYDQEIRPTITDAFWAPNYQTGFLARCVPATPAELAASEFPSLRALGSIAPKLGSLADDALDDFLAGFLAEPEFSPCSGSVELCEAAARAYVNLAAHLIHRPAFAVRKALPPAVARPLWSLSKHLNRLPSLTYASYVLSNFTSPVEPRSAATDVRVAQTPTGTHDEDWFVAIHVSVESAGGEIVKAVDIIDRALEIGDDFSLVEALGSVESCMCFVIEVTPKLRERLAPAVFRDEIRPLLYGHDRIRFSGVEGEPTVTYIGVSGAQSGVVRAVDAVLGVRHSEGIQASMNPFLACASQTHQRFFARAGGIGSRLANSRISERARQAHRRALESLAEFRRAHLAIVADYLETGTSAQGTGGTHFNSWLQELIHETEVAAKAC